MEFVSAEWVVSELDGSRTIKATGDDGSIWWVPGAESDVPPWPQFLEKNGLKSIKAPPQIDPAKKERKK